MAIVLGGGGVPQSRAWAGGGVTVWGQRLSLSFEGNGVRQPIRLPRSFEGFTGVPHWPPQPVRGVQGPAGGGLTAMGSILGSHGATRELAPNDDALFAASEPSAEGSKLAQLSAEISS